MNGFRSFLILLSTVSISVAAPSTSYKFREPQLKGYRIQSEDVSSLAAQSGTNRWLKAQMEGSTNSVEISSRITVRVTSENALQRLLKNRGLTIVRSPAPNVYILQATDPLSAAQQAAELAQDSEVITSCPVMRRPLILHTPYAYKPNDTYFSYQWHLEHRNSDGAAAGVDMNVRGAWPVTRGEGVIIGVADDGVEYTHPELKNRAIGMPHFTFGSTNNGTNGMPISSSDGHATAVAGLAVAELNNNRGVSGVAPGANIASWKIFTGGIGITSDEQMMDMFQFKSNQVTVQNHSWGGVGDGLVGIADLENIGISNAVKFGRGGRGVVMVRSGGNGRLTGGNANDDAYVSDPRSISVAAVRLDGRATQYSSPGACLLVAAPSAETFQDGGTLDLTYPSLFTTDRQGTAGYNFVNYTNDLADYGFNGSGFSGTSGSAPQISGVAALILSVNTNLTWRDVQQIMILSARHFDLKDPDLKSNGAGFLVSHNDGFGVPDAGVAVNLARNWINRAQAVSVSLTNQTVTLIPDDGLRVLISGINVPTNVASIPSAPSLGIQADQATSILPIVDVGEASGTISQNLTNKAALIARGTVDFITKLTNAANAGAAFAIVYNNRDGDARVNMGQSDFSPIPAVFLGQNDGVRLRNFLLTNSTAQAQLKLNSADFAFTVTNTLVCEHVAVRIKTTHPRRRDVRITVLSPQGTRSVLQRVNNDTNAGPVDWTYYSTHHFFESSAGTWTVSVGDEDAGATGSVQFVSLTIDGTAIQDVDQDGLDDGWEQTQFNSLTSGPKNDPDGDGFQNAREQITGTNPTAQDIPFQLDFSRWNENLARLSWPGSTNFNYQIWSGTNVTSLSLIINRVGTFAENEWFTSYTNATRKFFQIRAIAR